MKGKGMFFVGGIALILLNIKGWIQTKTIWIVLCFVAWFILLFIEIHRKNKDRNTPRPVYLAN